MTNPGPRVALHVTRQFVASAGRVFDAWLDPERAGRWLFATAGGQMVRVEIDARVGGGFVFVDRRDGVDIEHTGRYEEVDRPRRLVFTFSVPRFSAESTRVIVDIVPADRGCTLTLTHEGVYPEYASRTEAGWTKLLAALDAVLDETAAPPSSSEGAA
jgi:uncharacterized protein YndB with AHSA1/START domain